VRRIRVSEGEMEINMTHLVQQSEIHTHANVAEREKE